MSDLIKRIKRNLSRSGQLRYGDKVAYLIPSVFSATGMFGLKVLKSIEKKYSSNVITFTDDCYLVKELKTIEENVIEKILFIEIPDEVKQVFNDIGLMKWWRRYRTVASYAVESVGFNSLIIPMCSDAIVKMEISSIASSNFEGAEENALVIKKPSGFSFINLYHGITCREVSFFSYLLYSNLYEKQLLAEYNIKRSIADEYAENILASAMKWRSGEILNSVDKSLRWLLEKEAYNRCKFCGGLSLHGEVCEDCKIFNEKKLYKYLEEISVKEC